MRAQFINFVVFTDLVGHADTVVLAFNATVAELAIDVLFVVAVRADTVSAFLGLHTSGTSVTPQRQASNTDAFGGNGDCARSKAFTQLYQAEGVYWFGESLNIGKKDRFGRVQFQHLKKITVVLHTERFGGESFVQRLLVRELCCWLGVEPFVVHLDGLRNGVQQLESKRECVHCGWSVFVGGVYLWVECGVLGDWGLGECNVIVGGMWVEVLKSLEVF